MVNFPSHEWVILNQILYKELLTIFYQQLYIFVAIINSFPNRNIQKVILLPVLSYQYCIASIISVNGNFVEKGIISFLLCSIAGVMIALV